MENRSSSNRVKKRILRGVLLAFAVLLFILIGFFSLLQLPSFQTYLGQQATHLLSNAMHSEVKIEQVSIRFFDKAVLKGFYMADANHDTMIYAKELKVNARAFRLFKKEFSIKDITLQDAKLHLKLDSTGKKLNLDALLNLFKSKDNKPSPKENKGGVQWNIDLKNLVLANTDFDYKDQKAKSDIRVKIPYTQVAFNDLGIEKKVVDIQSVLLSGVDFTMVQLSKTDTVSEPSPPIHFLPKDFAIKFGKLQLENCRFTSNNKDKEPIAKGVDFNHLALNDINLEVAKGWVILDTIFADISSLSAKEQSGFELQKLKAETRVSVNDITLKHLTIQTSNSHVNDNFSLAYNSFDDFKDFISKVRIHANFSKTEISVRDLNYFIHGLDKIEQNKIELSGLLNGSISNLSGKKIELKTGNNTVFSGDFTMVGLPNIYETSINLRINKLNTDIRDIRRFVPTIALPPNLLTLGKLRFQGSLDGFLTDFVMNGNINTDNGSANSDLNFKYNKNGIASYSGDLALIDFNLGKWFGDEVNLGKVSAIAKLKGQGIKIENLNTTVTGTVQSMVLRNYEYKDLKVDGQVKNESFQGKMQIRDPNLDMDFEGFADISKKIPEFRFSSNIHKFDLRALHLAKDSITIVGKMTADAQGDKIDKLVGTIALSDVTITRGVHTKHVNDLKLTAKQLNENEKELTLKTDFLEAEVKGKITFTGLPAAIRNYAYATFTKNFEDTLAEKQPQDFQFNVLIYEPGELAPIIYPAFKMVRNSKISGNFNSGTHEFNVNASIPELVVGNVRLDRATIKTTSHEGQFDFASDVNNVFLNDSLLMDTVSIRTKNIGKGFRFDFMLSDYKSYNRGLVSAILTPEKNAAVIRMLPSEVILANNLWHFSDSNSIRFEGKKITTNNLQFYTSTQSLSLETYQKHDTSNCLRLVMKNSSLSDFVQIFNQKNKEMSATVNGSISVEDVFSRPLLLGNLTATKFMLGKELIGDINVQSELDNDTQRLNAIATINSPLNDVKIAGYYSLGAQTRSLNFGIDINKLSLGILNYPFFDRYVKDVKGSLHGKLALTGTLKNPDLLGEAVIDSSDLVVPYINVRYKMYKEEISFEEGLMNIHDVTIYDRFGNKGIGGGFIYHDHFHDVTLDFAVKIDKNIECLNTNVKQSPVFYGQAFASGLVTFKGITNNIVIRTYAKTNTGTHVYIPINNNVDANKYSFYKFVKKQSDTIKVAKRDNIRLNGLSFILDLDVTPDGIVDIQLDPAAGDVLSGRGRGNIKIEILKGGDFGIYGLYEIQRGDYLFTLQNIINKKFLISPGGTINFNGSIGQAVMNVDATYSVRTNTYDLIEDLITSGGVDDAITSRAKNRILVQLLLKLNGVLQNPDVSFDIRTNDVDPSIRTYVENKLAILHNNDAELNKQAFGLLVMNRFLPTGNTATGATSNGTYVSSSAVNTVSEFLSSQLSLYLNNWLSNYVQGLDFNINFRQYDANSIIAGQPTQQQQNDIRRELQLALNKRFFNDRLSITAGGNVDFGDNLNSTQPSTKTTTYVNGDFSIEYSLTKDGRWRAKVYNRGDYDNFYQRNLNRTGLGLSYRQDFDNFKDLFRRRNRRNNPANLPPKAVPKPEDAPKVISGK